MVQNGDEIWREDVLEIQRPNFEVWSNFFMVIAAEVWNKLPEQKDNMSVKNLDQEHQNANQVFQVLNHKCERAIEGKCE